MKKGKKLISLLLSVVLASTFVLPTFAAEVSSLKAQNEIRARNKVNVAKYAISFVDSMYNSQNFEAGNVITLYSENDGISGYCIDIMKDNKHNGYVVVKFSDNKPVVSEFAIETGIQNPYHQIMQNANLPDENLMFYSIGANEYQILDQQKDVVYKFGSNVTVSEDKFKEYKKEIKIKKQTKLMTIDNSNNTEKTVSYSDLDGWSVITDSYKGSSKSKNMIVSSTTMSYYGTNDVDKLKTCYACAVVALSNLMKYYRHRGYTKISSSFSSLYNTFWDYAGTKPDGGTPIKNQASAAKKYLESVGYSCSYTTYGIAKYNLFTYDIDAGKPCLFTYGADFGGEQGAHTVLVIGYVDTTSYQYLHVADGWNSYLRFINFNGYNYSQKYGWAFSVKK